MRMIGEEQNMKACKKTLILSKSLKEANQQTPTNIKITCGQMQIIGLGKYKNWFGRNPTMLQKRRLYANANNWV